MSLKRLRNIPLVRLSRIKLKQAANAIDSVYSFEKNMNDVDKPATVKQVSLIEKIDSYDGVVGYFLKIYFISAKVNGNLWKVATSSRKTYHICKRGCKSKTRAAIYH